MNIGVCGLNKKQARLVEQATGIPVVWRKSCGAWFLDETTPAAKACTKSMTAAYLLFKQWESERRYAAIYYKASKRRLVPFRCIESALKASLRGQEIPKPFFRHLTVNKVILSKYQTS